MLAKSLQQENDVIRFQLNDLINREKNQVSALLYNIEKPVDIDYYRLNALLEMEFLFREFR